MTIRGVTTVLMAVALLSAAPAAWSAPPEGVGGKGKPGHSAGQPTDKGHGGAHGSDSSVSLTISAGDRVAVRDYYGAQFKQGSCPPGLAKKNNGCLPPGQAKKLWAVGQPLPPHLVLEDLPPKLLVNLSVPPDGYKYVRAAADILLIATGTSMVVGAIEDLGRR
jgi:hypothetical protein